MRRLFTSFIFSLFVLNQLVAQGTMHKQHGHFTAHLDFFNNHPFKDTKGRIPHPLPLTTNGLKNTSEVWYEEKGVKVKGLIQSAAMQVDWWLLFGEPTEQYEFQWVSSGYYDIVFTDKKGKAVNARIIKDKLAKYPDLLKRFNNLAPTALDFEINWRIGSQTDADREAFKQRYKLLGSIGSSMPHLNSSFKTTVKNSGLLFEPSGIKPFAVPGIGGGKGRDFLGLAANYDETKLSQIFAYWKISTGQVIQNFSATKNDWPVDEMKAIAEKYLAYENGEEEPTPKEQIAKAEEKNKNIQAYAKDDFWGDAVEETFTETELITSNDYRTQTIKEVKSGKSTFIFNSKEEYGRIGKIGKYFYTMAIDPDPSERYKRYDTYYYIIDHKGKKKKILGYEKFIKIETYANSTSDLYILESEKLLRTIKLNMNWNQSASHEFTTDCNEAESQILKYENPPKGANANAYYRNLIKIRIDNNTLRVIKMEKGCDAANWFSHSK